MGEPGGAGRARVPAGRGLEEEILREFRVGYAPSAWDRVLLASAARRLHRGGALATGLAQRSQEPGGSTTASARGSCSRSPTPAGRVLGFGARAMGEDQERAKYLNTSDGEVYHKGLHLYGADLARAHAAGRRR